MFGRRWFGRRWFGPRWWGSGGNLAPPVSGACEYSFTAFADNPVGTTPLDGWTKKGASTNHSMTPAYTTAPFKRRAVTLASSDSTATAFSLDAVDAFGDSENIDLVVCLYRPAVDAHDAVNLYARSTGTPGQDGYQLVLDWANDTLRIFKNVANVNTELITAALTHAAGEWKLYRFRVVGDTTTTIRGKAWDTDEAEPAAWDAEFPDSSSPVTGSGWVGIGGFIGTGSASSKINFFSVASGGCSAYLPVMNAAFDSWLDTPNRRCVLADLPAIGFDSPSDTKTVYARIANMGFNTDPWDDPPSFHYPPWITKIPTFRREMGPMFAGRVASGLGSLVVDNGARVETGGAGARDDWTRVKWKRDYTRLRIGDPSWSKQDFREFIVGRVSQPTASPMNQLTFTVADLSDAFFTTLVQQSKFDDGPNINSYKPVVIGAPAMVDLPVLDQTDLTFQMNDGALAMYAINADGLDYNTRLLDDGIPMFTLSVHIDADGGTDEFQLNGGGIHGYANGYTLVFTSGGAPTGFSTYTPYYLVNTTSTKWQLSATPGGSAITFAGVTTDWLCNVYAYQIDFVNGIATLETQPATSRISVELMMQNSAGAFFGFDPSDALVPNMLNWTIFEQGGISAEFKDSETFDALADALEPDHVAGVFLSGREQADVGRVVDMITRGTNTFYGVASDGLIYVGLIDLPTADAVDSFTDSQVAEGSLILKTVIRPIDFSKSDVTFAPTWFEQGPLTRKNDMGDPVGYLADKTFLAPYDYGAGTTPLDSHPEIADAKAPQTIELIYTFQNFAATEQARLANFYSRTLGVFEFRTKLRAAFLRIGDTIELVHPRLGWKFYDGATDPISPDTAEDFDATKAVVIGIEVDLSSKDPFPVKLTVFRQIPGYYPEEDLN